MKRLLCLAAALMLALTAALPAFAAPVKPTEEITVAETLDEPVGVTLADEPVLVTTTAEPWTNPTVETVEMEPFAFGPEEPAKTALPLDPMLTYAALGASVLALLLAVIALARTGGKGKSANAAGNYQKFF